MLRCCQPNKGIYQFQAEDIDGNMVKMSKFKDKVILIVNVACLWHLATVNYCQLEILHEKYASQGLVILAFPTNSFEDEPWTNAEIKEHAKNKYKFQFRLFNKIEVLPPKAHPLFKYLQEDTKSYAINMNFIKFLIDRKGNIAKDYQSDIAPLEFENDIIALMRGDNLYL